MSENKGFMPVCLTDKDLYREQRVDKAEIAKNESAKHIQNLHGMRSKISNYERITRIECIEQRRELISELESFFKSTDPKTLDNLPIPSLKSIEASLSLGETCVTFSKFTELSTTQEDVIAAYKGGKLLINIEKFNAVVMNPKIFYKHSVKDFSKKMKIREFAIDNPNQVRNHIILHELGHKIYADSKLLDKYDKLVKLRIRSIENKSILGVSWYAKNSADVEDFFSEIFAIYVRGGKLPKEMGKFVLEVINAGF